MWKPGYFLEKHKLTKKEIEKTVKELPFQTDREQIILQMKNQR